MALVGLTASLSADCCAHWLVSSADFYFCIAKPESLDAFTEKKKKNHVGNENTPYINLEKDTLAERAMCLPHQKERKGYKKVIWTPIGCECGSGGSLSAHSPKGPGLY
eukprot:403981-Pelagomonas_calceolata.AAC.1